MLIGGRFTSVNGQPQTNMARLNLDGSLDNSFSPVLAIQGPTLPTVTSLLVQADGKILVGGRFNILNNVPSESLGRLNSDGTVDTTFRAQVNFGYGPTTNSFVFSSAAQQDGKILIAGLFTEVNGYSRNGIARIFGESPIPDAPPTIQFELNEVLLTLSWDLGAIGFALEEVENLMTSEWRPVQMFRITPLRCQQSPRKDSTV